MVRNYKKKTNRGETSEKTITLAVKAVIKKQKSIRQAALDFNIKKSTLFSRVKLFKLKHGNVNLDDSGQESSLDDENEKKSAYATRQIFSIQEENQLEKYLIHSSKINYGLTYLNTRKLAYEFALQLGKKIPNSWSENGKAGRDWMLNFMKRHRKLSHRKPENTSLARASAFNKHNVERFFENLISLQNKYKFSPDRILNTDETGVTTVLPAPKVIAPAGQKQVGQIVSGERGTLVTFCGIVSATGVAIPPVYIFPRQRIKEEYLYGSVTGAVALGSKTGWMTTELFPVLLKHIIKYTNCTTENPILLIIDNHGTHISLEAINYSRANGIVLLSLPPHSTHRMQPLDVCVYGPFKSRCKVAFNDYISANPGKTIRIQDIARLTADPYLQSFSPNNIVKGFQRSGIWPINRLIFTDEDFLGAEATDRPDPNISQLPECDVSHSDISLLNTEKTIKNQEVDNCEESGSKCIVSNSTQVLGLVKSIVEEIFNNSLKTVHNVTSLEEIIQIIKPYPKAAPRKKKRNSRTGCSRIFTDSVEKNRLEQIEMERNKKEAAKQVKKQVFPDESKVKQKTNIRRIKKVDSSESSDSEIEMKKPRYHLSDSDFLSESEDNDDLQLLLDDEDINKDDYLLVRFPTKRNVKYYVGLVVESNVHADEFEVKFLRKKKTYGFCFPDVEDIATVLRSDVVSKLPPPTSMKATSRLSSYIKFDVNFANYNIQ